MQVQAGENPFQRFRQDRPSFAEEERRQIQFAKRLADPIYPFVGHRGNNFPVKALTSTRSVSCLARVLVLAKPAWREGSDSAESRRKVSNTGRPSVKNWPGRKPCASQQVTQYAPRNTSSPITIYQLPPTHTSKPQQVQDLPPGWRDRFRRTVPPPPRRSWRAGPRPY